MRVKIGDMSKLYNISPHTLRYYDELGIVTAQKNEAGYRFYGVKEMEQLERVTFLRSVGVSIEEIHSFLKLDQINHIVSEFQKIEKEIGISIKELQSKQKKMHKMWKSIESIKKNIGKFSVQQTESLYGVFVEDSKMKEWAEECEQVDNDWLNSCVNAFRYDTTNIENSGCFGLCNSKPLAKRVNGYEEYPSFLSMYTSFIGTEKDLRQYLQQCKEKLELDQYQVEGTIIVVESWHFSQNNETVCASEIWLPIKYKF